MVATQYCAFRINLFAELSELCSLEILNVACNQLIALPASIGRMAKLRSVDFTLNKVSHIPDGMLAMLAYLGSHFHLYDAV